MTQPFGGGQAPTSIRHVDQSDFKQAVLASSVPVLVDFYADWCGPCQALAPRLEELAREVQDAKIVKVNVDRNQDLAAKYRVSGIPTLLVFKNGEIIAEHAGMASMAQLKSLLSR